MATWRRVWLAHDRKMLSWPLAKRNDLMFSVMGSRIAADFWTAWLDQQHSGKTNSYAVGFMYSCFVNDFYSIVPHVNLITNIGFGADATHTRDLSSLHANAASDAMVWPLIHPAGSDRGPVDRQIERTIFSGDINAHCEQCAVSGATD